MLWGSGFGSGDFVGNIEDFEADEYLMIWNPLINFEKASNIACWNSSIRKLKT